MLPFSGQSSKYLNMRLETERLLLRKFEESDVERMFLLDSNPDLRKVGFEKTSEFVEPDGICFWYELKREKYFSQ